jgi:hypothetical protein
MSCCEDVFVLKITRGKVTRQSFGYADSEYVYRPVSEATQAAPCVLTVTGHDLPSDWVFDIEGAKGMPSLNRQGAQAKVVDEDHLELNDFNATNQSAYTGGAVIKYSKPGDLSGKTAVLSLWRNFGDQSALLTIDLEIDAENSSIILDSPRTELGSLEVQAGAFGIDIIDPLAEDEPEEFLTGKFVVKDDGTDD